MTIPIVYCVLRQSDTYNPARVEWLRRQIKDAHLVTIGDNPGATIPLLYGWHNWWAKMELFRPDIPGDVFFMDLDTVVTGDVAPFLRCDRTTMLSDFYKTKHLQSSLCYFTEADRETIWRNWLCMNGDGPAEHIRRFSHLRAGYNGDQNFIEEVLGTKNVARWQDRNDTPVCSYKVDIIGKRHVPNRPNEVIIFHGKPRPWDVQPWSTL